MAMDGNGIIAPDSDKNTGVDDDEDNMSLSHPHLQLVDANAQDCSPISNKSCAFVNVKEEPENRDSDGDMEQDDGDRFIGGEIYPDEELGGIAANEDKIKCANCNLSLTTEESLLDGCKNFHEFLPLQLNNTDCSGDLIDVEFIDAISEIFKLQQRPYQSFKKMYQRNDLYLCKKCCDILVQMYKLYNEFTLIAAKSSSFLSSYISRRHQGSTNLKAKDQNQIGRQVKLETRSAVRKDEQIAVKRIHKAASRRSLRKKEKIVAWSSGEEMEQDEDGDSEIFSDKEDEYPSPLETPITTLQSVKGSSRDGTRSSKNSSKSEKDRDGEVKSALVSVTGKTAAPSSRSLICPEVNCFKIFTFKKLLDRHVKIHGTDGKGSSSSGECDRCGKKFKTLGGLKIHYASHTRDDKKHSCKMCTKKFRKQEALEMHVKTDHGGFKPHQCSQCEKTFRLKDKLKLHIMVIHNKTKPFPCSKCEKSFRTKYHLKIHDVSQHIQGGDSTVGCSQCKCKFPDRDALEKHVVIHQQDKPFVCDTCSKGFQTAARLKLHEKSHQEVPSCLCPICGRAYKHIRDLRLHEVIHQDESTYRFGCGDCPRRFYRIDLLRVHQSNEKHFASETIGPSISKGVPNKKPELSEPFVHDDEDEEEDENETDTEIVQPPAPPKRKSKKKLKTKKESPGSSFREQYLTPSSSAVHTNPSSTVIYHPSNILQLQLEQPSNILASSGMKNSTTLMSSSPYHAHAIAQQRHINQVAASSSYFITQRDRQNILHHPSIQIQTMPSGTHSQIPFGNQTVYTSHPINISNNVPAGGTDTTGFDFINSFNLG